MKVLILLGAVIVIVSVVGMAAIKKAFRCMEEFY